MRKLIPLVLLAGAAFGGGQPLTLDPGLTQFTFTDCAAGGSAAQTVTAGSYLVTATDEDVYLCWSASSSTCAAGGVRLPSGFAGHIAVPRGGRSVSCRSAGATGDLQFTVAN